MGRQSREDELPQTLEVLWRRVGRGAREPRQRLTLDRIVESAIQMAEAEGLPALSMARLAERLGCATMALYRHVHSKDELYALMIDTAPGMPPSVPATNDWRDGLARWARALREVYLRHPWILQIPVSGPPLAPGQLAWLDCGLRILQLTQLAPADKLSVVMLMLYYVRGEAQLAHGMRQASQGASAARRSKVASYGARLAKLVDREHFPALAELIAAGVFEDIDADDSAADFEFGLARIIDGIAALVRSGQRTSQSRAPKVKRPRTKG